MATYNYYLRKPNSKKQTPIILFVSINNVVSKISTGESIDPKYWDKKKQLAKPSYTGSPELNAFLISFKGKAHAEHRDFKAENIQPSTIQLRKAVEIPKARSNSEFKDTFSLFIKTQMSKVQPTTIKKYKSVENHLKEFQEHEGTKLSFDSIDLEFLEKFSSFLVSIKNQNNNTVCKYIKAFKSFMLWAFDRNIHKNLEFKKFKVKEYSVDVIYLTEDELLKIKNLDLSDSRLLERVRDAFCLGCFTGQRYSDIYNLCWEDIRNGVWYLHTKKTKELIEIPLNDFALDILRKYEGKLRPIEPVSNAKMNEHLKTIAGRADIKDQHRLVNYKGNKRYEETKTKSELISTHTARRTFVTLSLEKGMRPETVMEITGHKDYKTLKRYIKITSKVKEVEMKKIWNKAA